MQKNKKLIFATLFVITMVFFAYSKVHDDSFQLMHDAKKIHVANSDAELMDFGYAVDVDELEYSPSGVCLNPGTGCE